MNLGNLSISLYSKSLPAVLKPYFWARSWFILSPYVEMPTLAMRASALLAATVLASAFQASCFSPYGYCTIKSRLNERAAWSVA